MTSDFGRWEKDPFFPAAEEVQDSADRMESAYRTWIHERKDASGFGDSDALCMEVQTALSIHERKDASGFGDSDALCREVQTALSTTRWQLEEFERAVRSSGSADCSADDAKTRHSQFIVAIENQISAIETSLQESAGEGMTSLPWVRLDEGERDELALFLAGTRVSSQVVNESPGISNKQDFMPEKSPNSNSKSREIPKCFKEMPGCFPGHSENLTFAGNSSLSVEPGSQGTREGGYGWIAGERANGHRRTASASADTGAWKIAIADEQVQRRSFDGCLDFPPNVHGFSGFLKRIEATSKLKWSKNSFSKWKGWNRHQADAEPLTHFGAQGSHQLSRGLNACYERSNVCLDSCSEQPELPYSKQLYGCLGAVQRQLQRSQYQIQYVRPVHSIDKLNKLRENNVESKATAANKFAIT